MNLIRTTLRALVEETLKLRFGGGKSDPETSNPNNHGETNFQTMAKNHRCFGKRSRTDTQMHQNCLYFGAITMFIEVHVADKPKSSKFSDLTLAWVCLKKRYPISSDTLSVCLFINKLDDGWPESEKNVFQAALRMVVVKDSR